MSAPKTSEWHAWLKRTFGRNWTHDLLVMTKPCQLTLVHGWQTRRHVLQSNLSNLCLGFVSWQIPINCFATGYEDSLESYHTREVLSSLGATHELLSFEMKRTSPETESHPVLWGSSCQSCTSRLRPTFRRCGCVPSARGRASTTAWRGSATERRRSRSRRPCSETPSPCLEIAAAVK